MSAHEFRGDDEGYLSWLASHPAGYLINIHKSHSPDSARLHHASCYTLRNRRGRLTDPYIKRCDDQLADLQTWAIKVIRAEVQRCGTCNASLSPALAPVTHTASLGATAVPAGRYLLHPPEPGSPAVTAWADNYIHFKPRPQWQSVLLDIPQNRGGMHYEE